jgi:serine phosphatase RsbU (regulator of sigma subunit)
LKFPRWSNVFRRVTTAGPYVDERLSIVILTLVVLLGISAVAYADKSTALVSLAPLYLLPLALSALVHPLRVSLALSVLCVVLHNLLTPVHDSGAGRAPREAAALLGYIFVVVVVNQLGTQRKRLAEVTAKQRDELAEEIQLAAEVQHNILPRSIPTVPGFELAARMYPAKIVAGDYYGFFELPSGEIGLVVADVSGKGVAAGLLMPSIEVVLRMDAPRFLGTNDLLVSFNNVVHQITAGDRFISLFYAKLRPRARSLEYTNAGHYPPLVIRDGQEPILLNKGGPVLGVVPGCDYESARIDLETGDVVVLFTDGVVEAESPAGEEYSARRLATTVSSHLQQNPGELVDTILASVTEFRGTDMRADDLTLVVMKTL